MPHQTEPSANNAMGSLLQGMLSRRQVLSENTQTIAGHPGLRPDILITAAGCSPVVVEAEYMPAAHAEAEAKSRLGLEAVNGRVIEAAIALRYPEEVGDADNLFEALKVARLSYCAFTEESGGVNRFPASGWLDGSAEDLADLIRLVSLPQRAVDEATTTLQEGISGAAKHLDEVNDSRPAITAAIARLLGMTNVPQTRRMACAIIANAMVFHERIAGIHEKIRPLSMVCGDSAPNPQGEVLAAWSDILDINYWAIFAIAKDILEQLPSGDAANILRRLRDTAQSVNATGVDNAHDLTGRIFQRLIADRKYLATFYTLPASAALLARLAVAKMDGVDWSDPEAIGRLKVADFACGTGALLSAVYDQVAARHERAGGDPAGLHRLMMEEVLYGFDVMPSAIHITGSTLSGVEPSVGFENSRLYTMPYGRQEDGSVKIGSLELLQSSTALTLFNTSDPAMRTGSAGEETAAQIIAEIPDEGFDMVIMNPPFTRNTGHESSHISVFNPAFAAFDASDSDQRAMSKRMDILKKGTCYHGNAGIASAFAALAHRKLRPGGVLALVLPLSAAGGLSWQGFRQMIAKGYTDLAILSSAAFDQDMSFSSDTGMAECLVIARKRCAGEPRTNRAHYASLDGRPRGFAHASALVSQIIDGDPVRQIEDGPYGGTSLLMGDKSIGETVTAPCLPDGESWSAVRLSDYALAQTAYALSKSTIWLPGRPDGVGLRVASLGEVSGLGLYHLDISGPPPRAPFAKTAPSDTATYPCLWSHNASQETRLVCVPDSQLQVRQGLEKKAAMAWSTASRTHINRDFRFNSQPLAAAFTELASIGGRAWPNVILKDKRLDYAFVLWANSTLGLLSFWWHSNAKSLGEVLSPSVPQRHCRCWTSAR